MEIVTSMASFNFFFSLIWDNPPLFLPWIINHLKPGKAANDLVCFNVQFRFTWALQKGNLPFDFVVEHRYNWVEGKRCTEASIVGVEVKKLVE